MASPVRGEVFKARQNLEVVVLAVWQRCVDVSVIVAGERSRPVKLARSVFEELFHGPVRLDVDTDTFAKAGAPNV